MLEQAVLCGNADERADAVRPSAGLRPRARRTRQGGGPAASSAIMESSFSGRRPGAVGRRRDSRYRVRSRQPPGKKFTHKIDPDIDLEREYVGRSLDETGLVAKEGYILPSDPSKEARTATGAGFHSDGRVLVIHLIPKSL